MRRLFRLYHTLRPLRWRQWWFRAWHPFIKQFASVTALAGNAGLPVSGAAGKFPDWTVPHSFDPRDNSFVFLNRRHSFGAEIDWNHAGEGPLWMFNLQYFEWLYDEELSVSSRLRSIASFCAETMPGRSTLPYPASLRIMSWIRFGLRHNALDEAARNRLFQDAHWLLRFPEYQLDGNHLFENGLAIFSAGCWFSDGQLRSGGWRILERCIREQICRDGGHCEGSPMYHSLLLWRLMQCIEITGTASAGYPELRLLRATAEKMLGWLRAMTFSDGTWPAVNDAAAGIAPEPAALFRAAAPLGLEIPDIPLSDSGYRMIRMPDYELFVDVGGIAPDWQPGHAHADTGTFCLHVDGRPVIVDTGASTYEDLRIRRWQRGTAAHNTPFRLDADSSEMWSRFRVGKRCRILRLTEAADFISVRYRTASGHELERTFFWNEAGVRIVDRLPNNLPAWRIPLHFQPGVNPQISGDCRIINIEQQGFELPELNECKVSSGFNILLATACLLLTPVQSTTELRVQIINKRSVNGHPQR